MRPRDAYIVVRGASVHSLVYCTQWLGIGSLREAVVALVRDGDAVALEGSTHLIPFAACHEVLRQGRNDLGLIRMTPDMIFDQMIGAGAARRLVDQVREATGWPLRAADAPAATEPRTDEELSAPRELLGRG